MVDLSLRVNLDISRLPSGIDRSCRKGITSEWTMMRSSRSFGRITRSATYRVPRALPHAPFVSKIAQMWSLNVVITIVMGVLKSGWKSAQLALIVHRVWNRPRHVMILRSFTLNPFSAMIQLIYLFLYIYIFISLFSKI